MMQVKIGKTQSTDNGALSQHGSNENGKILDIF